MSRVEDDDALRLVAWRRADGRPGHSMGRLARDGDGWVCDATEVLADPAETLACQFRIGLTADWLTRDVDVIAIAADGRTSLTLRADAERRWWRDGVRVEELDGCVDVDVAATPMTNTFPIRRYAGLAVGARATAPVAWVEVASLRVLRVEQTYERLGPRRWRYSDPTFGGFLLSVDEDGLVLDYEGFATRVD